MILCLTACRTQRIILFEFRLEYFRSIRFEIRP